MSEEFDKKLRDRITNVFDNYEGSSADAGWALLREKYPEKDNKRPWAWWWFGVAAGLLLIAGTAFWLTDKTPNAAVKPLVSAQTKKQTDDNAAANTITPVAQQQTIVSNQKSTIQAASAVGVSGRVTKEVKNQTSHSEEITQQSITKAVANRNPEIASQVPQSIPVAIQDSRNLKKTMAVVTVVKSNNSTGDSSATKKDTAAKKAILAKTTPKAKVKYEGKKVFLGVFASAYYNFHDDFVQNNPINVGGGVSADIRLSDGVKLSTGLGVFQNSANYYPSTAVYQPIYYSNYYGSYFTAKLLTLELPVSLKVNITKRGDYLAGGFSSAAYITENYRQTYYPINIIVYLPNTPNSGGYLNYYLPPDNITQKHFNTLIWGKSLDLAAGIVYPLGNNQIVFEPFLKYPFNRGNENPFAYGSAGLNLRFTFGSGK